MEQHYLNERKSVVRPSPPMHRQPPSTDGAFFMPIPPTMQLPINLTQRMDAHRKNLQQAAHLQSTIDTLWVFPPQRAENKPPKSHPPTTIILFPTIYPSISILHTYTHTHIPYIPIIRHSPHILPLCMYPYFLILCYRCSKVQVPRALTDRASGVEGLTSTIGLIIYYITMTRR